MNKIKNRPIKEIIEHFLSYQDVLEGDTKKNTLDYALQKGYSASKYAQVLQELAENKEPEIHALAQALVKQFNEFVEKIGHENVSIYSKSTTWAYWDIAKQYYLSKHPKESNEHYELANPLTSKVLKEEMVLRHIGWDLKFSNFDFNKHFNGNIPSSVVPLLHKATNSSWELTLIGDSLANIFDNTLASWAKESPKLITYFQKNPDTNSMRDIALNFDKATLLAEVKKSVEPPAEVVAEDFHKKLATDLHTQLFHIEPTAMLVNMIKDPTVPMLNNALGKDMAQVLGNQADFNIKTTSVYELFKNEKAFEGLDTATATNVRNELKIVQRIAAISPLADAVPVLYNAKLHTALQVSDIPTKEFKTMMAKSGLSEVAVAQICQTAQNLRVRNEQALMALKEVSQMTGIALIDKSLSQGDAIPPQTGSKKAAFKKHKAAQQAKETAENHNLSWDLLFGDADICECGECTSVYSAASYYVELLQYLRNNNLDPNPANDGSIKIKTNPKDISGTPLAKLFERRPDLGCLELTCKNTNTILPYVDLVNEVMEHYVAFEKLKAFNVEDETSGELLAEPQHTEYQAYCILKNAVYPFTLPYHQPIDATRIYLNSLGTSRYEVIDTFRKNNAGVDAVLTQLQDEKIQRAADAEFLGMSQEEYKILTKECFESKTLRKKTKNKSYSKKEYETAIGIKSVKEYYGLAVADDLETLKHIKKEFLPRTGIDYFNLVDLLKTEYINPCMPKGKSKAIMESLHFSYRFLQNYAAVNGKDKLVEALSSAEKLIALLPHLKNTANFLMAKKEKNALSCPDTCKDSIEITDKDLQNRVKCNHFENIEKLIVIESGKTCV
ncbi:MAG: hypothetical protein RLZZ292_1105, partial [Bacteroidota bacterium]